MIDRKLLMSAMISPELPNYRGPGVGGTNDIFPPLLAGSKIVNVGSPVVRDADLPEGGGLVIDYIPEGESQVFRVVFGFTELGMWIESDGPRED